MGITNRQIIALEMATHGIYEEVHTFAYWKNNGYKIKRGSKALFTTEIWKPCKVKVKDPEEENPIKSQKLILVKASFFGISQVEKQSKPAMEK